MALTISVHNNDSAETVCNNNEMKTNEDYNEETGSYLFQLEINISNHDSDENPGFFTEK